jgi:heat shock protein HslJ
MRALHRTLAVGTLGLLLVACSLLPGALNAALDGEWRLQAGTNQGAAIPIAVAHPITLKIDGTQAGGTAACNQYGGKLAISGTTIKISELFQTEMACLDGGDVMTSEAVYLAALPRVATAARDGDSLVLSGPQVELHFTLVPPVPNADLVGPLWTLDSLISGQVASSVIGAPTLQLNANGTLAASTGCRDLTGHYAVSGNTVQVTLDPYDMIACADPLGAQDTHALKVIGAADGFTVVIQGESMTVTAGDLGLAYRVVAAGT